MTFTNIFTNNIEMEPSSNLVNANSREPLERFIGAANLKIRSHFTNTVEDFFDFVLRHTLKRPRDLMAIGASISNLAPVDRKDPEKLKAIVFKSARDVVLNYI